MLLSFNFTVITTDMVPMVMHCHFLLRADDLLQQPHISIQLFLFIKRCTDVLHMIIVALQSCKSNFAVFPCSLLVVPSVQAPLRGRRRRRRQLRLLAVLLPQRRGAPGNMQERVPLWHLLQAQKAPQAAEAAAAAHRGGTGGRLGRRQNSCTDIFGN